VQAYWQYKLESGVIEVAMLQYRKKFSVFRKIDVSVSSLSPTVITPQSRMLSIGVLA
jgi:hypothetical protein